MAINREKKEAFVAEYTEKLARSQAAYIADYRGLKVADISDLRTQIRKETNAELDVAKNTLLSIAFREAGWSVPAEHLAGPTAVLFCYEDPIAAAKVLTRYAKKNDLIKVKGGVINERVMGAKDVEGMAELPPREQILASLIGAIQGPAQNLFGVLTAPMREIAQVLHARSEGGQAEG